jgi:hypothetical protein
MNGEIKFKGIWKKEDKDKMIKKIHDEIAKKNRQTEGCYFCDEREKNEYEEIFWKLVSVEGELESFDRLMKRLPKRPNAHQGSLRKMKELVGKRGLEEGLKRYYSWVEKRYQDRIKRYEKDLEKAKTTMENYTELNKLAENLREKKAEWDSMIEGMIELQKKRSIPIPNWAKT